MAEPKKKIVFFLHLTVPPSWSVNHCKDDVRPNLWKILHPSVTISNCKKILLSMQLFSSSMLNNHADMMTNVGLISWQAHCSLVTTKTQKPSNSGQFCGKADLKCSALQSILLFVVSAQTDCEFVCLQEEGSETDSWLQPKVLRAHNVTTASPSDLLEACFHVTLNSTWTISLSQKSTTCNLISKIYLLEEKSCAVAAKLH